MRARVAVVGCGQWGLHLVRNFHALGALSAVSDVQDTQRLSEYGVPIMSFEDILEDPSIDSIVLAVPAPLHAPFGLRALEAGKHVLIEKPMGLSFQEVTSLITVAEAHNRILMGGHLLRYHPAFVVLEQWVTEEKLGKILFIDAYRQTFGRVCHAEKNVFWSLAPHDISLILALMGSIPHAVYAMSDKIFCTEDQGVAHLSFSQGRRARIFSSWIYPKKEQRLVVMGTKGALIFDDTVSEKLMYYSHSIEGEVPTLIAGKAEPIFYDSSEPLAEECQHFLSAITNGTAVRTDGRESLKVLEVLEAITASIETGTPVLTDLEGGRE